MPLSLWAWDTWLTGSVEEAELQWPLPAARLQIVETNIRAEAVGQGAPSQSALDMENVAASLYHETMHPLAFCPNHGLFEARGIRFGPNAKRAALLGLTYSCPLCRTASEAIPGEYSIYGDRLNVLVDPTISVDALIALRNIVVRLQRGELTAEEAEREATKAVQNFGGLLNFRTWPPEARAIVIAALIAAIGSIIAARSTAPDVTTVHIHPVTERISEAPKEPSRKRTRPRISKPRPKPRKTKPPPD